MVNMLELDLLSRMELSSGFFLKQTNFQVYMFDYPPTSIQGTFPIVDKKARLMFLVRGGHRLIIERILKYHGDNSGDATGKIFLEKYGYYWSGARGYPVLLVSNKFQLLNEDRIFAERFGLSIVDRLDPFSRRV